MAEISVIIPCYNQEKHIAECLDSVLAQTFTDFEAIVVNDGSTDNSAEIIDEYAKKDARINVITQENQGVVVARNNAIAHAQGQYIYPLDGDDKIAPTCLEKLHKMISTTNYRVVASEVKTFGKNENYFRQPKFNKYEMYGWHECCVISALFYKEDFEKFGGYKTDFNGYGGDDMDYWLNYPDNGYPMIRLPDVLFFYRVKAKEKSIWKNYSRDEFKTRTRRKENLLKQHHPQIRFWNILWRLAHSKIIRIFYRTKIKNDQHIVKILGLTIFKKEII